MAQKTGQEETEFKSVPETLNLCINNCGVIGNPSTNNMCQNCFHTTSASSSAAASILSSSSTSSSSCAISFENSLRTTIVPVCVEPDLNLNMDLVTETNIVASEVKRVVNRCSGCKRKVGLTGFRCRCGEMFCSEHRYSDRHDCSYDYKSAGRKAIARENPVVRAAKIVKV